MIDKNVLVLEDEIPLSKAIKKYLENNGLNVVVARTAEQAYKYLEELDKVDFIWADHYLLGEETGLDFIEKIKANDAYKKIPVFVVSNTASADKVKGYLSLGVDKYYVKAKSSLEEIVKDIKNQLIK